MINDDQRDANQNPTQFLSVPNHNETNLLVQRLYHVLFDNVFLPTLSPHFMRKGVGVKIGKSRLSSEDLVVPE